MGFIFPTDHYFAQCREFARRRNHDLVAVGRELRRDRSGHRQPQGPCEHDPRLKDTEPEAVHPPVSE
jgi:hypothetical protein